MVIIRGVKPKPDCGPNTIGTVYQNFNAMSNILSNSQEQFPGQSVDRKTTIAAASTATIVVLIAMIFSFTKTAQVQAEIPTVDRNRLTGIVDDAPLTRAGDKAGWDYLFGVLRECSQEEIERLEGEWVGFLQLQRQPVEYRGRLVQITGRLVRCEFVPQPQSENPLDVNVSDDNASQAHFSGRMPGFYESWVLVKDEKHIPISVCTLEVPVGFPVADGLDEQVTVTGFFYKRRLFLSADDEEVTTPTILAKSFHWISEEKVGTTKTGATQNRRQNGMSKRDGMTWALVFVIALWLVLRYSTRRIAKKNNDREPIRFDLSKVKKTNDDFDGRIVIPGFTDTQDASKSKNEEHPTVTLTSEKTQILK